MDMSQIKQNLEYHKQELSLVEEKYGARSRGVYLQLHALGRNYDFLGKKNVARQYFLKAGEIAVELLENRERPLKKPRHAGEVNIEIAFTFWYADDSRATIYFEEALINFQKGYEARFGGKDYTCYLNSVYCLLFLGRYLEAVEIAEITYQLAINSSNGHIEPTTSEMLLNVAQSFQEGTLLAMENALESVEQFLDRVDVSPYNTKVFMPWINVYPLVIWKINRLQFNGI